MKRTLLSLLLVSMLLWTVSCARAGHIEVLTPLTSGAEDETRREVSDIETEVPAPEMDEILEFTVNLKSKTFHRKADCAHAKRISEENRKVMTDSAMNLMAQGYVPCKSCSGCFAAETDETA